MKLEIARDAYVLSWGTKAGKGYLELGYRGELLLLKGLPFNLVPQSWFSSPPQEHFKIIITDEPEARSETEYQAMLTNLSSTQKRCTELVEELRLSKNVCIGGVAALQADLKAKEAVIASLNKDLNYSVQREEDLRCRLAGALAKTETIAAKDALIQSLTKDLEKAKAALRVIKDMAGQ